MADNNTLLPYDGILRFDAVYDAENQRPAAASTATGVYLGRFVLEQDTNKIYQKIYKTGIGYDWRYVSQLGNYVEKDEIVSVINDGNEKISYSKIDGTPNLSNYITTNNLISKINEAADTININKINGINNYVTSASIIQKINSSPEDVKISADKLAISGGNFDNYYTKTQINNILGTRGSTSTSNYPYYWYDTSTGRISVAPSESSSLLQTSLTEILTQLAQSSLTAGNGINIDNNHEISVKIDSSTIAFDSSHQLQVKLISSGGITSGSNGIYVKLKSNGGISCNENGELYLTNGSSSGTTYTAGNNGILINNTNNTISLQYNSNQFKITSAGLELTPVVTQMHWNSNDTLMEDSIQINNSSLKTQGGEFTFDLYENQINKLVSFYGAGTFVGDTLSGDITIWSSKLLGGQEVNASRPEDSCRCGIALITTNYNELPTETKEVWLVRDAVPGSTKLIIKDVALQSVSMGVILMGQYSRV